MNLTGTQWNMQQQLISQYSQEPTNLQLSLRNNGELIVTAAGQTYQGHWSQSSLPIYPHIDMSFAIGSTTFSYSGFFQPIQQQYGMGGSISVNGSAVGTWDALSTPAS